MGFTVLEHDLFDMADAKLGNEAFRLLVLVVRRSKAQMRWGCLPQGVCDEDMPGIVLGQSRLGWKSTRRKYYSAIKQLEDTGFITVTRRNGAALEARLTPSSWQSSNTTPADACETHHVHQVHGETNDHVHRAHGDTDNHVRHEPGDDSNRIRKVHGSAPIQYKHNTPPTTPEQDKKVNAPVYFWGGGSAFDEEEEKKLETTSEQDMSPPEPAEAIPLLDALHRRQYGSPMPESWRGALTTGVAARYEALESREAFDATLRALDTHWRRERETLQGEALARREAEVAALAEVVGAAFDCWCYVDALRDTLFLEYHRLGRRFVKLGRVGSKTHLRELAAMVCRRLGAENTPANHARIMALLRKYGRGTVVEHAETLRSPGDRNGIRDVLAVLLHRLKTAA